MCSTAACEARQARSVFNLPAVVVEESPTHLAAYYVCPDCFTGYWVSWDRELVADPSA
jgi:hypothetical protein